ncbi:MULTISPECIES: class I SAM-dependent methyltransferase [Pseudomonas]|uniref:SAM-dependent methyltransferase n=1 Tax=Pseudomonas frederiksbergensis TaxID=104087 RepID=A0A2S8HK70_9PSED|nr:MULTISPECIES: class I SAM-dependent methyltransferase [Pseudomonas]PQP02818.1 SAM-dependent methyltransferase [Pseudomonas frederiksbergensis]WLG50236.1 methyltransferase domain-containing protein [Pseudomonas sp. FP1742]
MTSSSFFRPASEQQWDASQYENNARLVAQLANGAVELLALKAGERVLDIGCGDGYLSEQLARQGAEVVGFDYSPEQVKAARLRGLDVRLGNAEELIFHQEFDAVFSNAAMHWMRRADQVAHGAFMALKPGGRFVGEFAGAENALLIRRAIHGALERRSVDAQDIEPWYLPTAGEYQRVLENAGFHVSFISWFERPLVLDYSIAQWIQTFGSPYLTVLPVEARADFLEEVTEELANDLLDSDGRWTVDYTRLRFRAEKKA